VKEDTGDVGAEGRRGGYGEGGNGESIMVHLPWKHVKCLAILLVV